MARSQSSNKRKTATKKKSAGSRDSRKTKRSTTKKSSSATKKTKSVSSVKKVVGAKDKNFQLSDSDLRDIEQDSEAMHRDISRISRQLQQVQGGVAGQDLYNKETNKSCYLPDGPRAGYGETCFSDGSLKPTNSSAVTTASHVLYTDSGITVRGDYESLVRIRSSIYNGKGSISSAGSQEGSSPAQQAKKDIFPSAPKETMKPVMAEMVGKPDKRALSDFVKGALLDETNERIRNTFYKCIESLST